ncbi:hypothetical protein [Klebsiella phage phiKp_21]|nr:hypothetical protein DIDNDMLP_00277 [Klebsiella phage KP13-7]BEH88200.1 hypothetical protein [Klebsiella phage phiKp_21]
MKTTKFEYRIQVFDEDILWSYEYYKNEYKSEAIDKVLRKMIRLKY